METSCRTKIRLNVEIGNNKGKIPTIHGLGPIEGYDDIENLNKMQPIKVKIE